MEDLAKHIAEKAGITPEQAKLAADAAIEFIRLRVASAVDTKVEAALGNLVKTIKVDIHEAVTGEAPATWSEKIGDIAEDAQAKLGDLAEDAKEKLGKFAKSATSFFGGWGKKGEEKKLEDKPAEDKKS
ncbi:MAG: hypothetical protein MUE85_23005 [Microscillaceae bacterium]|jgi:hypothetical protein|nr:hypothetical protein [Microscillaceae bacterium]